MVLNLTNTAKFPTSFKSYAFMRDANMTEAKRGITTEGVTLTFTVAWAVPAFHRTSFAVLINTKPRRSRLTKNCRHPQPLAGGVLVQEDADTIDRTDIFLCHHMLGRAESEYASLFQKHHSIGKFGGEVQVVRDHHGGRTAASAPFADEAEHHCLMREIQIRRRLVQ